MAIEITTGSIDEVLCIDSRIPEFTKSGSLGEKLEECLSSRKHLILVARVDGELAGYKIGYELSCLTFYSWLGGVLPKYRRQNVATKLREYQESWAKESGYGEIEVKSMNRFPFMLQLLITSGYQIHGYDDAESNWIKPKGSGKILFYKKL